MDASGKIDLDVAMEALKADPSFGSHAPHKDRPVTPLMETITTPPTMDISGSYLKARAIREQFAALREKTRHEVETGALIDSEGTRRALTSILAGLVQSLDKAPDRACAELPDEYHHETRQAMRREIDSALVECRRKLEKLLPKEASA